MEIIDTFTAFQQLKYAGFLSNCIIAGDMDLYSDSDLSLKIDNCEFKGNITFKGKFQTITIEQCELQGSITIYNAEFLNLLFSNSIIKSNLKISNCTIGEIDFRHGNYELIEFHGINAALPNKENIIKFTGGNYRELRFASQELSCEIKIKSGKYNVIHFTKNKSTNQVHVGGEDLKIDEIYIQSCTFNDVVLFDKILECTTLWGHKVTFEEQVILTHNFRCHSVNLSNTVAKQNISFTYANHTSNLTLNACDFQSSFNCHKPYSILEEVDFGTETLSLDITGTNRGNLLFESIHISAIDLAGISFSNIVFKDITTHIITIKDFYNQSKVLFADLKIYGYSLLIIFDSNVNNIEFVNIDFRKFNELVIAKSEVSNILLSNSILPPRIQIGTKHPNFGYIISAEEKINDNTYYRETYRQLKLAMEKQGNKSYSLIFKSKEMHYLRKEERKNADKLLLYLNYISNNHGLSWSRGVLFTLAISWLMFVLFEASLKSPDFVWSLGVTSNQFNKAFNHGLHNFTNFWASFPLFKDLNRENLTWGTNVIIILSRIFIGYGIYQTVVAFRKFGSK